MQEVVSKKDQPLLRLHVDRFEPQLEFVHPAALATAFTQSRMLRRTLDLQATPFDKSTSHPAALLKSMYGVPKREHLKALLWRETVLISRNSKATTYRHIQMAWLACMVATGFLRGEVTNTDTVRVRSVLLHRPQSFSAQLEERCYQGCVAGTSDVT